MTKLVSHPKPLQLLTMQRADLMHLDKDLRS